MQFHSKMVLKLFDSVATACSGGSELLQRNQGVYHRLTRGDCEMSTQIKKDLHRTFPNHIYFAKRGGEGQKALFRVLKAYACYDPEVRE